LSIITIFACTATSHATAAAIVASESGEWDLEWIVRSRARFRVRSRVGFRIRFGIGFRIDGVFDDVFVIEVEHNVLF